MQYTGAVIPLKPAVETDACFFSAAELLRTLAFDHRLTIARALQTGARTLIELRNATGLAFKPLVSSIRTLLQSGLVAARRRGGETVYELGNSTVGEVVRLVDAFVAQHPT